MDDAAIVRRLQRLAALQEDGTDRRQRQGFAGRDQGVQGMALQELHHEVVAAVPGDGEVEDLEDVVVADEIDGAGLVEEALDDPAVARVSRMEELDGDARADDGMLGEVDRSHPAPAEKPLDPVRADDGADERISGAREEHAVLRTAQHLVFVPRRAVGAGSRQARGS